MYRIYPGHQYYCTMEIAYTISMYVAVSDLLSVSNIYMDNLTQRS